MNISCPHCGATVGEQIGGKFALAIAGALLGSRMSPAAAFLFALGGALLGHYCLDRVIRRCPQCSLVFTVAGELLG
jgi:phage tail tape-measure protein